MTPEALIQAYVAQQMMGQNRGMQQEVALHEQLGPEGVAQQANLGSIDERKALAAQQAQAQQMALAQQLSQADEFGKPQGKNYHSVAGNVVGGIGDIIRQVGGGIMASKLRGQQADMMGQANAAQNAFLGQQDKGRLDFSNASYEALKRALAQQGGGMQMPQQPQQSPFGLTSPGLDPSLFGGGY